MAGLWTQKITTTDSQQSSMDRLRKGMIPGTWLSLAPTTSPRYESSEKWLSLSPKCSPLHSPNMNAQSSNTSDIRDDLSLTNFLSNSSTSSRSTSVSGVSLDNTKKPCFHTVPPVEERETLGLRRFLAN